MEIGNTRTEKSCSNPYWSMYQDIKDVKMGLKSFDELRKAWSEWAQLVIQEKQNQAQLSDLEKPDFVNTDLSV